jgi:mannitol/fructose-specific phosphotransferase system IIA component (Ntr-type)
MKISDILSSECIRLPLRAREKMAAITELVDLLAETGMITNRNEVLDAVRAREQQRSTGIGQGLAVPHGKSHGCQRLVMAIGKPAEPIEFNAIDHRPCSLIVLLTSPHDKTGPHIQALAGISRLWQNPAFRQAVDQAESADDLYNAIKRLET